MLLLLLLQLLKQSDLDELLASSSVFNGNVTINSVATLNAFHSMGSSLAIVNGNVTFLVGTDMDMTKVQEVADAITQSSKDYAYTAGTGVTTEITFNNLTATRSLTLDQKGGYVLQNLAAATIVTLDDDSTADIIDLRGLTSVTSLNAGSFHFAKATELHLTKLPRYDTALSLRVDEGGVIDITALRDVDALGVAAVLDLTLDGPDNITISALSGDKAGSDLTLKNVVNATVNGYDGKVTIGDDVQNFTSDGLVDWAITGDDLVSVNVTGILDPNASIADTKGPAVLLTAQGDLETVTLAGKILSADVNNNGNLVTLTITAEVQDAINVATNSDLTTVALTGAKASGITFNSNSDLEALTIDLAIVAGTAASAVIDGIVVVTDNESLETLNVSTDKIETLTVTGNDDLTTVDFTGLATFGATGKPTVSIYDNDLEATKFTDTIDVTASVNGGATDIGTINSGTSGMSTLKTYLTAVAGDADSTATVYFDTVSSFISEAAVETTDKIYNTAVGGAQPDQIKVLVLTANSADAGDDATTAKRSFLLPDDEDFALTANGTIIHATDGSSVPFNANQTIVSNAILDVDGLAKAAAAGVVLTTTENASPIAYINIGLNTSLAENSATAAKSTFAFAASDTFTMSIDGQAVTITGVDATPSTITFVNNVMAKWNALHGSTNTAIARWVLTSEVGNGNSITDPMGVTSMRIIATANDKGSREIDAPMSASWSTTGFLTDSSVGIAIGNTQNYTLSSVDNKAQGNDLLVTIAATTAGSLLAETGNYGTEQSNAVKNVSVTTGLVELSSSYNPNIAASNVDTASNLYVTESRLDVVIGAELNAAAASNAVSFSRVTWL